MPVPGATPPTSRPPGGAGRALRSSLRESVTAGEAAALADLAAACERADGRPPVSEQTLLHARYGEPDAPGRPSWVLVWAGPADAPRLVGAAHWDDAGENGPVGGRTVSAEWMVAPDARAVPGAAPAREPGREADAVGGVAWLLLTGLREAAPDGVPLDLWVHGEGSWSARALAALASARMTTGGLRLVRTLWQMRRPLGDPDAALDAVAVPAPGQVIPLDGAPVPAGRPAGPAQDAGHDGPGLRLRTFRVGVDEPEWLELNAHAFANHPDQGRWTAADLAAREREAWFDPAGFFVAERVTAPAATPRMVGFHWTKVHEPAPPAAGPGQSPTGGLGEIYVLGVDPGEQGSGLGRSLARVGLAHLRRLGLATAMLYVEADNAPAVHLYASLGFVHHDTDRMYRL